MRTPEVIAAARVLILEGVWTCVGIVPPARRADTVVVTVRRREVILMLKQYVKLAVSTIGAAMFAQNY
ncbi:MAG: hypothetical protein HOW97_25840 [Catenulispora sp.]|nr:hypothetical protein [Catenulispora sp.]